LFVYDKYLSMSVINELIFFLKNNKTQQDERCTHTGMYFPLKGSWSITDYEAFWDIYTRVYDQFKSNQSRLGIGLTETQTEHSPVLIDIDIKTDIQLGTTRIYTHTDVYNLIAEYRSIIQKYVHEPNLDAYIFEKPAPRQKEDHVKDGFHVMFTNVVVCKRIHTHIHEQAKRNVIHNRMIDHLKGIQSVNDLIDSGIVSTNWMIYGTVKQGDRVGYECSKYVRNTEDFISVVDHDIRPRFFSIHEKQCNVLTENGDAILKKDEACTRPSYDSDELTTMDDISSERAQVTRLLTFLKMERCENEPDWIRVGMCLRNINVSYLDLWENWSKTSTKYKDGVCQKQWGRFKTEQGLKINSLIYWARSDNPTEYDSYLLEITSHCIESSVNCGAHYDIANILHCKYQDKFRCINPKRTNDWYYFDNHRWHEMPGGWLLMNIMSTDLSVEFSKLANTHKRNMVHTDPNVVKEHKSKYDKCMKLAYNVKDNSFKTGVLRECSRLFFDPHFEHSLDSDVNLIGFNNGIYDIGRLEFRDGNPDDFVSKSTGIDYLTFSHDDKVIHEINDFFEKVHPDQKLREYVLTIFATFLGGSTDEQTFQIWTGGGSNGKSTTVELFETAFGPEYTGKFSTTLLTRDRANSNACTPELQDVMRKRFASMQEPNDNDVIYTGAMKEYTGGDKIYSRGLFSKPTPFKPQFKLVMLCNKMPTIKGWDYGTWRRIRVVKHMSSFVDAPNPNNPNEFHKDRKLTTKFEKWKEAFMWMLIERLKVYTKQGVVEPQSVLNASKDYKKKSDAYMSFLDDNFELTASEADRVSIQDMYELCKMWWRNTLNAQAPTKNDLLEYVQANTKYTKHGKNFFVKLKFKNVEDM